MSVFTLCIPRTAKSAVKLGYPTMNDVTSVPGDATIIHWGNSQGFSSDNHINKPEAIRKAADKIAALQTLARHEVPVPRYWAEGDTIGSGFKVVVRPNEHAEGSDFEVHTTRGAEVVPTGHHATEYIPDTREYRVWAVRKPNNGPYSMGYTMLCARRVPRRSEGQTASDLCRSKWGYEFCDQVFPGLSPHVTKAMEALGLDFGALDCLWKPGNPGRWYILEVNTAPSLDTDRVLSFMKGGINALVSARTPQETPRVAPRSESRPVPAQPGVLEEVSAPAGYRWQRVIRRDGRVESVLLEV